MPTYEVEWTARGTASVEADDPDEAEDLVKEGVEQFTTVQFEEFEVEETEILSTTPL